MSDIGLLTAVLMSSPHGFVFGQEQQIDVGMGKQLASAVAAQTRSEHNLCLSRQKHCSHNVRISESTSRVRLLSEARPEPTASKSRWICCDSWRYLLRRGKSAAGAAIGGLDDGTRRWLRPGGHSAFSPRSSLRMRMASSTRARKILPSPILPVRAAVVMAWMARSTR